jgi:hypothetical protein
LSAAYWNRPVAIWRSWDRQYADWAEARPRPITGISSAMRTPTMPSETSNSM